MPAPAGSRVRRKTSVAAVLTLSEARGVVAFALIGFVVAALSLSSATWSSTQSVDSLVVTMSARFDRSISSSVTKSIARQEAAEIWHDYGVEILWNQAAASTVHLEVIVASARTEYAPSNSFSILGRTELDRGGGVVGPIRVNYEAIEELLELRPTSSPLIHEREVGRALGRVLAHEIGHALLGVPTFHDSDGLMRAAIPVEELVSAERRFLQLSNVSVNRLHVRIACLGDVSTGAFCGRRDSTSLKD
jgi:hypothetical protein